MVSCRIYYNRLVESWQWGKRALIKDKNGSFSGNRAPIWRNPSSFFFFLMALWGFIFFVTVLFIYIFEINDYEECSFQQKPIMITELTIVGINSKKITIRLIKGKIKLIIQGYLIETFFLCSLDRSEVLHD